MIPVDTTPIILNIFGPFYFFARWHTTGHVGLLLSKKTFGKFEMFRTSSEIGHSITSETYTLFMNGLSCTCCTGCNDATIFLLFNGATLGT